MQKEKSKILLNVGDGAVITEEEFIKKVETKRKGQEKERRRKRVERGRGRESIC